VSEQKALRVTAAQAAAFRLQRQHLHADRSAGRSVVDVVRDTAGIQAQVQSAAELSIWTRRRTTTRDEIRRALWDTREVVKTSAMRLTLHLIPARDLAVYIAATRPSSRAKLALWQRRLAITPDHVRLMIETLLDSLGDTALTQQELIARAKKRAPRGLRAWLDHAWIPVRPAVIEGAIVYGPPRGAQTTFVRADRWLGEQPAVTLEDAQAELLRRFLRGFGPATAHDFAKWAGMRVTEARGVVAALDRELTAVSVDGMAGWMTTPDLDVLRRSELDDGAVRLLGPFDSFLLAHATKEHLVDAAFYKRVFRNQGWISAVVMRGGAIVGTWTQKTAGKSIVVDVDLFRREPAAVRRAIAAEVEALSGFVGVPCRTAFG